MALISSAAKLDAGGFAIDVRGKTAEARPVPLPFYRSRAAD